MLYKINSKYYIRVAPLKYTEVTFSLKNNEVVLKPTGNRIEQTGSLNVEEINFEKEKNNIRKMLSDSEECNMSHNNKNEVESKHRRRR